MRNVLISLWAWVGSRAAKRKLDFLNRSPMLFVTWLTPVVADESLEDAKLIINLFGKSYGIDPDFFRASDTVGSIHSTDWFGDRDLEIGVLMRSRGISAIDGNTTLIEFVQKMLPLDPGTKSKLQRMLGFQNMKK